ncbi:hypothetical protein H6G97_37690 [Nostoc flagelliforme FACHB-838]|uniref:Uncharacterized protein n=1 Tax=Nostoc flagelliforme FACHB-838 TaxID=2692904 RepID=A0ABR8E2M3_9NOSO|nr:hypothetical protein [Nostoc flagelliforme]MBD2534869.1 hypothetical protein [Nostoc flagelliforme FACHB-838]
MKGFKKLSSIVVLLFTFVYPPSLASAEASSLSNAPNEQNVATEANLVEGETGELLIAQRRYEGRRYEGRRYEGRRYEGRRYEGRRYEGRQFRRGQRYRRQQFRRQQYLRQRYRQRGYYGRPVFRPGIYIRL